MSRIRADRYTNRLGTGAPLFSNGVNITGNVGVGTTVPTSKLTVVGNMNVTGTVSVGGTLTYEDVTNVDSVGIITARSGILLDDSITHLGDTTTKIRFPAAATATVETDGNERFRVTSNGYIGIGTNSPGELLHMFSSSDLTLKLQAKGAFSPAVLQFKSPSNSRIDFVPDTTNNASGRITYIHSDDSMQFSTKASGGSRTERMRITNAGRIGLGRTDPATQLDGNKHAQFAGVYNGKVENSVNNNSGLILLHKLGEGQGFYFAGDIIVMSWTGQAKIDCILSAKYNNDQLGWNVRDAGGGGNNMVSQTTVKFGSVTYDSGTWACIKKDGGGSGVVQLNGFLNSNAKLHLIDGHQTLEITSGYSSFSNSATLN